MSFKSSHIPKKQSDNVWVIHIIQLFHRTKFVDGIHLQYARIIQRNLSKPDPSGKRQSSGFWRVPVFQWIVILIWSIYMFHIENRIIHVYFELALFISTGYLYACKWENQMWQFFMARISSYCCVVRHFANCVHPSLLFSVRSLTHSAFTAFWHVQ